LILREAGFITVDGVISSALMPTLQIEISDDLARAIEEHPLACPLEDYCRAALAEAVARQVELVAALSSLVPEQSPLPRPNWTIKEVAAHSRVSKHTVSRDIQGGNLEAIKVGSRYSISHEAAIAYGHRRRFSDSPPTD